MTVVTLSPKYQVVIPLAIREALGLRPGQKIQAIRYDDRIEFARVPYKVEVTAERIKSIPQLHDWLGDRLYEGR